MNSRRTPPKPLRKSFSQKVADFLQEVKHQADLLEADKQARQSEDRIPEVNTRAPRALTTDDIDSFVEESKQQRRRTYLSKRIPEEFVEYLESRHPTRVEMIRSDVRWVRRKARKFGLEEGQIPWWQL